MTRLHQSTAAIASSRYILRFGMLFSPVTGAYLERYEQASWNEFTQALHEYTEIH